MSMPDEERVMFSDKVDPVIVAAVRDIEDALWTFEWKGFYAASDDAYHFEERDDGQVEMTMHVWVHNTDDEDDEELKPLNSTVLVEPWVSGREQIREHIHAFLCHEADEQIWFDGERPFYPNHPATL